MQLLNSAPHHLLESLQDIANKVQIQSQFCICHPDYKPLELPAEAVTRFQRLPAELQRKYLNLQLQGFLYGIYYNGSMRTVASDSVPPNLENNSLLGIDMEFYERLHQSNCGEGYFDPGWQVMRQESDGSLAVTKGGLMLHVERVLHLQDAQHAASVGDIVALRMPKNLLQSGFYVAVGNAGRDQRLDNSATVRIYFHLTAEGAVAVMSILTRRLNDIKILFNFKVLYNPADYRRYDSGVLYFERSYYPVVRQVLQAVYLENQTHFQTEVPLFTKQLAPGLAVAEEPNRKFTVQESFGMNRCQIIANGLLQSWYQGETSPVQRLAAIVQNFSSLGIELERPFLNAGSEDIYAPLNL